MVISKKIIRQNKSFINKHETILHPKYNGGTPSPFQDRVYDIVKDNPNCTMSDIYRLMKKDDPDTDLASVRKSMRKMIERHKVRQRFTIENP